MVIIKDAMSFKKELFYNGGSSEGSMLIINASSHDGDDDNEDNNNSSLQKEPNIVLDDTTANSDSNIMQQQKQHCSLQKDINNTSVNLSNTGILIVDAGKNDVSDNSGDGGGGDINCDNNTSNCHEVDKNGTVFIDGVADNKCDIHDLIVDDEDVDIADAVDIDNNDSDKDEEYCHQQHEKNKLLNLDNDDINLLLPLLIPQKIMAKKSVAAVAVITAVEEVGATKEGVSSTNRSGTVHNTSKKHGDDDKNKMDAHKREETKSEKSSFAYTNKASKIIGVVFFILTIANGCICHRLWQERNYWKNITQESKIEIDNIRSEIEKMKIESLSFVKGENPNNNGSLPNNYCDFIVPTNNHQQDTAVIDFANNCWIHAQANFKLGQCASETKNAIKEVSDSIWNNIGDIVAGSNTNSVDNSWSWRNTAMASNSDSSDSSNDTNNENNDNRHQEEMLNTDSSIITTKEKMTSFSS